MSKMESMDKKILLVDDEPLVLRAVSGILKASGYAPYTTSNGHEALAMVADENIRVLFVDMRMPIMDGMALCGSVKKLDPHACVYALSGYIEAYSREQLEEAGFDAIFGKPFDVDEILDACSRAFKRFETTES